jgi:hypothetical protein
VALDPWLVFGWLFTLVQVQVISHHGPHVGGFVVVVVGISMYGCESFATSFQFFLLAFQLVVSFPHQ